MPRSAVLSRISAVAVLAFVAAGPAAASLIVVPNASFENPNVADGQFTDTESDIDAVPNWLFFPSFSGITTAGVWDPNNADYTGTTGDNAPLPGTAQGGQAAYIFLEQVETTPDFLIGEMTNDMPVATIAANTQYTLTVALGSAKTYVPGEVTLRLSADQVPVATVTIPTANIPNDSFADFSLLYTTGEEDFEIGAALTIHVIHTLADTGERSIEIDNVRLDATIIPEPAGATMLALALLGGVTTRRSRR